MARESRTPGPRRSTTSRTRSSHGDCPSPNFISREIDYWVPIQFSPEEAATRRSHYLNVVARLKPGVSVEAADSDIRAIARRLSEQHPETNRDVGAVVVSIRDRVLGDTRIQVIALMTAAAAIVLIARANLASLLLARASVRRGEYAVRLSLGATRGRLARQVLVEALCLSAAGGVLGLAIPVLTTTFVERIVPVGLQAFTVSLDFRLERIVRAFDPDQPIRLIRPMTELIALTVGDRRQQTTLLVVFGALALVIASLGLYGLLAQTVTARGREIGIRIALGATWRNVMQIVMARGIAPTGVGVGIGAVLAWSVTRALDTLLYGVGAADPLTFALVAGLLAAVSAVACAIPAVRAARVDPMLVLRNQ